METAPGEQSHAPISEGRPARRRWIHRLGWAGQWLLNLLVAAVVVLIFTPAGDWFGAGLAVVDPLSKADYIVVLGGDESRAVEAANLYRLHWAGKVIVTSSEDADRLGKIVAAYGVPERDIIIDRHAVRTADHPATVAQLPGVDPQLGRFIVVTSLYHTGRAKGCFAKFGYRQLCLRAPGWQV